MAAIPLPLSLPARWVLFRGRAYMRAVDAQGLDDVVIGLSLRLEALHIFGALIVLSALGALLALAFRVAGAQGVAVLAAAIALPALPLLYQRRWGRWTGRARVGSRTAARAILALREASGPDTSIPYTLFQYLWAVQVLHLLADARGRARLAGSGLEKALPGPPPAASRPRL